MEHISPYSFLRGGFCHRFQDRLDRGAFNSDIIDELTERELRAHEQEVTPATEVKNENESVTELSVEIYAEEENEEEEEDQNPKSEEHRKENVRKHKSVLITGASSGIGYELAKLFAEDNFDMVLVSRNEARLVEVAGELLALGAREVYVLPRDLSMPGAAEEIYKFTKGMGLEIDVLVNDAGVGEHGFFVQTDLEKELGIINLNVVALVHLTKLYLRDMVSRNRGRILQLASIASYQPTPLLAVYAATKAFVLSFSDALVNELKDSDVTVTSLIPGATDTDFFRKANMEDTEAAQNPVDPAIVAKIGYEALMKGEHHALGPGVRKEIVRSVAFSNENVASHARKAMEVRRSPELKRDRSKRKKQEKEE